MRRFLMFTILLLGLVISTPTTVAQDSAHPIGLLFIPSLHLVEPIYEVTEQDGVLDLSQLGDRVAHYGGTVWVGAPSGQLVLVGHTPGGFTPLHALMPGARIIIASHSRAEWYRGHVVLITSINDIRWLQQQGAKRATLITCAEGNRRLIVSSGEESP